ncbi:MAG: hypothetical protein QS748_06710 [Candidatus Endonucleobacter bathymodioli]|uniref:Uncharacterized protein n=1 Tax=Candidatus Endonucleibacter bathymodioli TaxID=539814 RepID=A0AA90SXT1_9GAMM|nr:hypothetical protein [Candidatus Endonucleobacter bathymodioli]
MLYKIITITAFLFVITINAHAVKTDNKNDKEESAITLPPSKINTTINPDNGLSGVSMQRGIDCSFSKIPEADFCLNFDQLVAVAGSGVRFAQDTKMCSNQFLALGVEDPDRLEQPQSQYYRGGLLGCKPAISIFMESFVVRNIVSRFLATVKGVPEHKPNTITCRLDTHPDKEKIIDWYELSEEDGGSPELDLVNLDDSLLQSIDKRSRKAMDSIYHTLKKYRPCYNLGAMEYSFLTSFISSCQRSGTIFNDGCAVASIESSIRNCLDKNEGMGRSCFDELLRMYGKVSSGDAIDFIRSIIPNEILCAGYICSVLTNTEKEYLTSIYNISQKYYDSVDLEVLNKFAELNLTDELIAYDIKTINVFLSILDGVLGKENQVPLPDAGSLSASNTTKTCDVKLSSNELNATFIAGQYADGVMASTATATATATAIAINEDYTDANSDPVVTNSDLTGLHAIYTDANMTHDTLLRTILGVFVERHGYHMPFFFSDKSEVTSDGLLEYVKRMSDGLYFVEYENAIMIISKNNECCRLFSLGFDEVSISLHIPSSYYLVAYLIRNCIRGLSFGFKNNISELMLDDQTSFRMTNIPFIFTKIRSTELEVE